jgi:hypothetical protein
MAHRHRTAMLLPFGQPFIFVRGRDADSKRVQTSKLRAACQEAFVFIEDYRLELLRSYCLTDANGDPIIETLAVHMKPRSPSPNISAKSRRC